MGNVLILATSYSVAILTHRNMNVKVMKIVKIFGHIPNVSMDFVLIQTKSMTKFSDLEI